jgi:membrane protease YdiL (CAAX protease family)
MELGRPPRAPQYSRATLIVGLYSALAIVALVIGGVRGRFDIYRLPHSTPLLMVISPLAGIALGLLVVFVTRLAVHRFEWARALHRSFRGLLGNLHARDIFILAVASSVGEELLFRGALVPWIGIVPSAVVFALLHIGPGVKYLPWTASALVAGLIFGAMFRELGDLGGPIAAHFTINYLNLGYIVRVELPEES